MPNLYKVEVNKRLKKRLQNKQMRKKIKNKNNFKLES